MEMKQTKNEWEEIFDKQFEGYWRGQAVPDEIKFFIRKLLSKKERETADDVEKLKKKNAHDYCVDNQDGCLECLNGYFNEAIDEVLKLIE